MRERKSNSDDKNKKGKKSYTHACTETHEHVHTSKEPSGGATYSTVWDAPVTRAQRNSRAPESASRALALEVSRHALSSRVCIS